MSNTFFLDPSYSYTLTPMIWIGVCVLCVLNLAWGVTLSGLVVPGFLVPLAMVYPGTAMLIVVEALITWGLTRLLGRMLPAFSLGSRFFGRDRFFALVLCSIFVRLLVEGQLLPLVASLAPNVRWTQELVTDATSFGLILVPLMANQLWKPGLIKGGTAIASAFLITFALVRLILIPWSGFSFANLALQMDLSSQYLPDSPQSYIILLTTIFVASRFNLQYGWDFSGIMFPGLIALSLFDPLQIATTLVETFAIVLIAKVLMLWAPLRAKALNGAYSLLIFFTISFIYKLFLGNLIPLALPGARADDFLGLGYVMSTMFAIKICRIKDHAPRLFSGLGQVAGLGCALGLAGSVLLSTLSRTETIAIAAQPSSPPLSANPVGFSPVIHEEGNLTAFLQARILRGQGARPDSEAYQPPTAEVLEQLIQRGVRPLLNGTQSRILPDRTRLPSLLSEIGHELAPLGFQLDVFPGPNHDAIILMSDSDIHRNLGFLAVRWGAYRPVGLVVGRPFADRGALEFALWSMEHQAPGFLVAPLVHPRSRFDGLSALTQPEHKGNLVNAVLSEMRDGSFPGLDVVEITTGRPEDASTELLLNPFLDLRQDKGLAAWGESLKEFGLPLVYGPDANPTYSFESTLGVGGKRLRTLVIPEWVQNRLIPLVQTSIWESRWALMKRPVKKAAEAEATLRSAGRSSQTWPLAIQSYLATHNPVHLLNAEAEDSHLRFELLKTRDDEFLLVATPEDQTAIRLTGFDADAKARDNIATLKERTRL